MYFFVNSHLILTKMQTSPNPIELLNRKINLPEIHNIVNWVLSSPDNIDTIFRLVKSPDTRTATNALWILTHVQKQDRTLLQSKQPHRHAFGREPHRQKADAPTATQGTDLHLRHYTSGLPRLLFCKNQCRMWTVRHPGILHLLRIQNVSVLSWADHRARTASRHAVIAKPLTRTTQRTAHHPKTHKIHQTTPFNPTQALSVLTLKALHSPCTQAFIHVLLAYY